MEREKIEEKTLEQEDSLQNKNIQKLEDMNWYFGDLGRPAAETILEKFQKDCFLVRNSSKPNHYALSLYSFRLQKVSHTLIVPLELEVPYYQLQDVPNLYTSVPDLVNRCPLLKNYYPVDRNGVQTVPISLSRASSSTNLNQHSILSTVLSSPLIDVSESEFDVAVEQALTGQSVQNVSQLKTKIKELMKVYEKNIQDFDSALQKKSLEMNDTIQISEEENEKYLAFLKKLEKLKLELQRLRLRGDQFKVLHKQQTKLFRITPESQMMYCSIQRTQNPQSIVPEDMTQYSYYNISVVENENSKSPIYEITSSKLIHYIDQLKSISLDTASSKICFQWKNEKKITFYTVIPSESEELVEVVGAHLKRFKQSTIKQIQLLKDIWKCRSTPFDEKNPGHQMLLTRLWKILMPDVQLEGFVSPQWKLLGFQGNNPATDFRGMGLLGLLNLIYFAEHYLEQAKFLIFSKRNYPWAATGINITSMLFDLLEIKQELIEQPAPSSSWHTPLLTLFYYADNDDTFDELYSQAFLLFDRIWVHTKADYMNFSEIRNRLKKMMVDLLKRKPLDINQFIAWIEQLQVSHQITN